MKIIITTVMNGLNQKDVDAYIQRLEQAPVLPGSKQIAKTLRETGKAEFNTPGYGEDRDSRSITTYEVIKDQQ